MTCIRVPGGFVCVGDSQIHTITVRGKPVRFEMTRFGPVTLTRAGDPSVNQPHEHSPFWPAFNAWQKEQAEKAK